MTSKNLRTKVREQPSSHPSNLLVLHAFVFCPTRSRGFTSTSRRDNAESRERKYMDFCNRFWKRCFLKFPAVESSNPITDLNEYLSVTFQHLQFHLQAERAVEARRISKFILKVITFQALVQVYTASDNRIGCSVWWGSWAIGSLNSWSTKNNCDGGCGTLETRKFMTKHSWTVCMNLWTVDSFWWFAMVQHVGSQMQIGVSMSCRQLKCILFKNES